MEGEHLSIRERAYPCSRNIFLISVSVELVLMTSNRKKGPTSGEDLLECVSLVIKREMTVEYWALRNAVAWE